MVVRADDNIEPRPEQLVTMKSYDVKEAKKLRRLPVSRIDPATNTTSWTVAPISITIEIVKIYQVSADPSNKNNRKKHMKPIFRKILVALSDNNACEKNLDNKAKYVCSGANPGYRHTFKTKTVPNRRHPTKLDRNLSTSDNRMNLGTFR